MGKYQNKTLLFFGFLLAFPANSYAITTLKNVEVNGGNEVVLKFTEKLSESQITVQYINDIIQLSLENVSIYPAKIIPVEGKVLKKIFAYQYSPKLVRCRFSVNGSAESLKEKFKKSLHAGSLSIKFNDNISAEESIKNESSEDSASTAAEEKALLEKITESGAKKLGDSHLENSEKPTLTGSKPLPSVWSAFYKLGIIILVIVCIAAVMQRVRLPAKQKKQGLLKTISRFTRGNLGKPDGMIEVVSTHFLDPKKSIAVVRVAGRLLILGVSNESINLITQILDDSSEDLEEKIEEEIISHSSGGPSMLFSDVLKVEKNRPSSKILGKSLEQNSSHGSSSSDTSTLGIRSRIKTRLEGLKPL